MMKVKLFSYLALSSIFLSGLAIINQGFARASTVQIVRGNTNSILSAISINKVSEDKLITDIANLEVQIILLKTRFTTSSPKVKSANQKLQTLRRQVQPNSRNTLSYAISQAIKTKIAELEVERAVQGAAFVDNSPIIQILEEDIKALRKSFAQIQPRNYKAVVNRAVSQSIKSKISELKAEKVRLKNVYSSNSENISVINNKIIYLEKRLAMFK